MKMRLATGISILLCLAALPALAFWIQQNVPPQDAKDQGFTVTSEPAKRDPFATTAEDLVAITISKEPGDNVLSAVLELDDDSGLILRCPLEAKKNGKVISFGANIKKQNADKTRIRVSELQGPPIRAIVGGTVYIDGGVLSIFYLEDYVEAPAKGN